MYRCLATEAETNRSQICIGKYITWSSMFSIFILLILVNYYIFRVDIVVVITTINIARAGLNTFAIVHFRAGELKQEALKLFTFLQF